MNVGDDYIQIIEPPLCDPYAPPRYTRIHFRVVGENGELHPISIQHIPARRVYLPQYSTFGFEPIYDSDPVIERTEPGKPDLRWKED